MLRPTDGRLAVMFVDGGCVDRGGRCHPPGFDLSRYIFKRACEWDNEKKNLHFGHLAALWEPWCWKRLCFAAWGWVC